MLRSHHLLPNFFPFPSLPHPPHSSRPSPSPNFQPPPPRSLIKASPLRPSLAQLSEVDQEPPKAEDAASDGPVELPPVSYSPFSSTTTVFATDDNPSPLQVATSVLLTGAISVFLFRALRRRARRAKDLRVRSTGMKKTEDIKEEALKSLKAMGVASVDPGGPPSPVQVFLGGIAAGAIALILYKFATTVEASLNRQAISDNFSVRQITITVRTIVNGICYLATFVFGINSVGLLLYSVQLAFNSFMENPSDNPKSSETIDGPSNVANDSTQSLIESAEPRSSSIKESSEDS